MYYVVKGVRITWLMADRWSKGVYTHRTTYLLIQKSAAHFFRGPGARVVVADSKPVSTRFLYSIEQKFSLFLFFFHIVLCVCIKMGSSLCSLSHHLANSRSNICFQNITGPERKVGWVITQEKFLSAPYFHRITATV